MTRWKLACLLTLAYAAIAASLPFSQASEVSETAASGDLESIRSLLEAGAPADARGRDEPTALMLAAEAGHTDAVRLLLAHGANPDGSVDTHPTGHSALSLAAQNGHLEIARLVLDRGAAVNGGPRGKSPLLLAIENERQEIALLLLRRGAAWKMRDWRGETLLMKAAGQAEVSVVKLLLAKGANVRAKAFRGWSALSLAVSNGSLPTVEMLLRAGADANEDGGAPLRIAAQKGDVPMILELIARGAKPNMRDRYGYSALTVAAADGHEAAVKALLARGASASGRGSATALAAAAQGGHAAAVIALLNAGVNPNARTQDGKTALFVAKGNAVIEALVTAGAGVNARNQGGRTPLLDATPQSGSEALAALLAHGADPNAHDKLQNTPTVKALLHGRRDLVALLKAAGARDDLELIAAVIFDEKETVRALLEAGADPNQRWADGRTPLIEAARIGHAGVIAELVAHGANVHARQESRQRFGQGWGPMNWAASFGRLEAMKALHEAGAALDERDVFGRTPLMNALWSNQSEAARWLLDCGAGVSSRDDAGDDPLGYAIERRHPDIARMLMARGVDMEAANRSGATPLMRAAEVSDLDILNALLAAGANPNARDAEGRTALMRAGPDHPRIAQSLLRHGARLDLKDKAGRTARDHAAAKRYSDLVRFFDGIDRSRRINERKPVPPGTVIYAGPHGLEGWRKSDSCSPGAWQYKGGALESASTCWIARAVPLPALASIEFTVSWNESLWLGVTLYNAGANWDGDFYELDFDHGRVLLMLYTGEEKPAAERHFEQAAEADIPPAGARVRILADRKARRFALVVDGRLAKEWTDPESPMTLGDGFMFQAIGDSSQVRLSKIRISAWDGRIPDSK